MSDSADTSKTDNPKQTQSIADIAVVLDSIDAAVVTINPSGIILEVNAACNRLFGYIDQTLVGQNVSVLMPEPYASEHNVNIQHHMETGHTNVIGVGRRVSGLRSNGDVFPLHLAVGKHVENGTTLFTGILHDLSNEDSHREDRTRLGSILNSSLNEIYVFDANTLIFSMVSRGALVNLGYSRAEMFTMTALDINPEFDSASFEQLLQPLRSGEQERIHFATSLARKDGTKYDVEVSLSLSSASESKREYIAIIEDVTDKNRLLDMMQQSQRLESIGQLTGGIAHDFNNILTVVSGNLQLLEASIDDDELAEIIKDARDASRMGARLTNRLLAFARRSTLMPSTVSVNKLVVEMIELLRRTIGENIYLSTHLTPDIWLTNVDVSQLENSLINLVINARDAMLDGGTLTISTENAIVTPAIADQSERQAGEFVRLVVSDTGEGIADNVLPHIYEPFYTTKPSGAGTGMGLSMVYGFVRQSNGFIEADSTVGDGTAFSLYLPRDTTSNEEAEQGAEKPAAIHHPRKRVILLVEDEERVRRLAKRQLEHSGHTVIEAVDGYDALDLFGKHSEIDLVFSDMIMSAGMTGYELAMTLRQTMPQLPIIITSGYAHELLDTEQLSRAGISLLRKPYSEEALLALLAKI